jgi:Arc/MetJ family transcription regulator
MRTTVTLDDDVAAAVAQRRRERDSGLSEAVNELIRAGLTATPKRRKPFVQQTHAMGMKINVDNVWEVIEQIEGPDAR